ncbi:MAG: prepilin-type N-terminal cleavage/methylation domain-containing protein [Nitrospirae bacterium]|nr:prepilin-type N-terminal cleavage/methylation domain-containing protein [Nitrospirota bacterium]
MNILFKTERGFTLLEVLIALAILSIGLLGISGLYTAQMMSNSLVKRGSTANNIALDMIEQAKNVPFYAMRSANASAPCQIASGDPNLAGVVDCLRANNGSAQYNVFNNDADYVNINTLSGYSGGNVTMKIKRTITVTAEQTDGFGDITLKDISVKVEWIDPGNPVKIHSVQFATIRDRGIL